MFFDAREKILECLMGLLAERELQLVDLIIKRQGKITTITVLTDKPAGGITIDECIAINRKLVAIIDEQQMIFGDYTIEVSSPGLDRPLKTKEDFRRVIGRLVRFYLRELVENKFEHVGVVKEVMDNTVMVETKVRSLALPLDKINKAVQEI